jgi:hypothetical protein
MILAHCGSGNFRGRIDKSSGRGVRNKLLKYDMGKKADFKLKFIVIPINLHL